MSNALEPIVIAEPGRRSTTRPKRHLRRVERTGRRSPALPILVGGGIVIAALFAIAVMHALMIGGQLTLDDMQREVASETEDIAALRLRVAELEAPDRVLAVAQDRLGMVQPPEVGYLAPLGTDSVDGVRVAVAERAPAVELDDEGNPVAAATSGDTADSDDAPADTADAGDPVTAASDASAAGDAPETTPSQSARTSDAGAGTADRTASAGSTDSADSNSNPETSTEVDGFGDGSGQ